jgi:Transcriptional regulator
LTAENRVAGTIRTGAANKALGLGRKGRETRARLLAATRTLLETTSPLHLTAAAIAKEAGIAPATLYVYFADVQDVLYALALETHHAFAQLAESRAEWFTESSRFESDAKALIAAYNEIYSAHARVLQYRSLEADRGNARFVGLQMTDAVPVIELLARAIRRNRSDLSKSEALADAVVFQCAMERLASMRLQFPPDRPGPSTEELDRAQARLIARHLVPPNRC